MKLKFIGFLVLYNVLMFFLGWNLWFFLNPILHFEHVYGLVLIVGLLSYSFLIGRAIHSLSWLSLIGSLWFGFIQYALILFPIADLVLLILYWFAVPASDAVMWIGACSLIAFAIIFSYGVFNAYSPVIRNYTITIPKKANRKSLGLVMASDMHFGTLSGVSHLQRLVTQVKSLNPDLILLPGDIIDDDPKVFIKKNMSKQLAELKAPLGVYGVLGNHEYYGGQIPQFIEEMAKINIKILMDEVIQIDNGNLYLVGRKDKTDRNRKSFEELMENVDRSFPIIAMDHQPSELGQAEKAGVDLILSGHTHRGQMAPNHLITRKIFENDWGYLKKHDLHSIVSSGFGFWGPPLRIGSRSEIVHITINFAE